MDQVINVIVTITLVEMHRHPCLTRCARDRLQPNDLVSTAPLASYAERAAEHAGGLGRPRGRRVGTRPPRAQATPMLRKSRKVQH